MLGVVLATAGVFGTVLNALDMGVLNLRLEELNLEVNLDLNSVLEGDIALFWSDPRRGNFA